MNLFQNVVAQSISTAPLIVNLLHYVFQVRHDSVDVLEGLKTLPLVLKRKLASDVSRTALARIN